MIQDFKRKVTERLLGALDPLAGVRLGKSDAQVLTRSLELARFLGFRNFGFGRFRKGLEILDTVLEIVVVDTRLEAQLVQNRACERVDQVKGRTAVMLARASGAGGLQTYALALGNVHPNRPREVLTNQLQLRPVLATLGVTLVGR